MNKDYYAILGITKSASAEEIKKAYRKHAHKYHPDKSGGDDKKFKEVNEAYQVLGNKEKRAQYDRFGHVFEGAHTGGGAGGFGFDPSGWNVHVGDIPNIDDIFENIFNGGVRTGGRTTYTQGSDIEVIQELALEEAFAGIKRTVRYKTFISCNTCKGIGHDKKAGFDKCAACAGKGEVRVERKTFFGQFAQVRACAECRGRGQTPKKKCDACKGNGRTEGHRDVNLEISPGVDDKQVIKIQGAGEAGEEGAVSGDLYVIVRVKPHRVFKRQKSDLFLARDIKLTDALLGRKLEIKEINGDTFSVVIPTGFDFNEPLRVPGKGMPRFGHYSGPASRGDLFITFNLKLPKKVSSKAKKLLEDLDHELY